MRPLKYPHAVLTKVASCLQFRPINRPHVKTRWLAYGRDVTRLRHYSEFMNGEMPGTCEEERQCRQVPVDGRLERRTVVRTSVVAVSIPLRKFAVAVPCA